MKSEFALAFNEVLEDKGLPKDVVLDALKSAMVSAYRRAVNASSAQHIEAEIDLETGKVTIYAEKEVVEVVQDDRTEVSLEDASKIDPEIKLGDMIIVESTPPSFGRVAAQTARQVIQQRIREAERDLQYQHFLPQVGEIISGVIQAINPQHITLGLEKKAEGIMPRSQQIPREHFRVHDRIRALLLEVKSSPRGPQIILSRAHKDFLRRLLENEVPEIYHGLIEIRSISREPGQRSKVAVAALQPGIDPVGACVGIRGVRIQAIVRELNDEKIDVIEWNPDASVFIAKALSPARVTGVYLHDTGDGVKTATVVVPEDQLSLAIGRDGQNARLAAKLTSWRIDIKSLVEAASEILYKIEHNPEYRIYALEEKEVIEQVQASLAKKSEGRPVTPEEYQVMAHFVDRVERGVIQSRMEERAIQETEIRKAKEAIPEMAFELSIDTLGLPERIKSLLLENKYKTVGDLMLQLSLDSDKILAINGVGPKAMEEIVKSIDGLQIPEKPEETAEETSESVEILGTSEQPEGAEVAETLAEIEEIKQEPADELVEGVSQQEAVPIEETKEEPEAVGVEAKAVGEEGEETISETLEADEIDDIFKLKPEMLDIEELEFDVEDFESEEKLKPSTKKSKKKKKKSKKYLEVEYDPDHDITLYRRKRKRNKEDWEDEWDF